jgi:quercetin dioxygenase-like cupin family protein
MKAISVFSSPLFQWAGKSKARKILLLAVFGIAVTALATPPLGFVLNQILAKGVVPNNIRLQTEITRDPDGSVEPWEAALHVDGATDTYVHHLILAPGGYSGWHTHPGILIATVVSGSIDFYDANCQKRSVPAGQVYFEADKVHAIRNTGAVNAEIYISYLIKHGSPRRVEADAPVCAPSTGIP